MTTLTIRIREDNKTNLDDAAYRVGFIRMKEGESRGYFCPSYTNCIGVAVGVAKGN